MTFDQDKILSIFKNHHSMKTNDPDVDPLAEPNLHSEKLENIADKYYFNIPTHFPVQTEQETEIEIQKQELTDLIKLLKGDTAPGKSGIDKYVLLFFLEFYPSILLAMFNELISNPNWEDFAHSSYLKKRKIIFLAKKGKDSTHVENYRPIALLETIYKLISKVLI